MKLLKCNGSLQQAPLGGQLLKIKPEDKITKQLRFSYACPASTGVRLEDTSLLTGEITQVALHFPDGCDALVSVAFGHEQKWTCPSTPDTYIALNDATPVFTFINEEIHRDDVLWVIIENADGSNAHTISVIVTLEGVETPIGAL